MPTKPPARNWKQGSTGVITDAATPAPKVGYLTEAVTIPLAAALGPYCGCAKIFDGQTSGLTDRYFGSVIAPFGKHARMGYARCFGNPAVKFAVYNVTAWTASGGNGAADVITSKTVAKVGNAPDVNVGVYAGAFEFDWWQRYLAETGAQINDVPAATTDRQFELTSQNTPYVEAGKVSMVAAFALWVSEQQGDIE